MRNIVYLFLVLFIISCNNKASENLIVEEVSAQENLLNIFPIVKDANDSLHFYNIEDDIEKSLADSIVENGLPESLFGKIGFQTGDVKYEAMMQFPLDENHIGCVLNINESWYKQQSLLVFDKSQRTFEKVINLSQFYGGDGGQIVIESWLYKNKEQHYLYQKESSHAMIMTETSDEPEEFLSENSSLSLWNANDFEKMEMTDSVAMSKTFALSWEW